MKTLMTALLLISAAAHAHDIKGTMVRPGVAKGTAFVRGAEVKCSMDINGKRLFGGVSDVRNALEQDQYGNPAYKVTAKVSLKSKDREIADIKFEERITFINLHDSGVSDSLYVTFTPKAPAPTPQIPNPVTPRKGTEAKFVSDDNGNITSLQVQTSIGPVNCSF